MIEIKYRENGDTYEIDIGGHAGYSGQGDDIVCAGVSAILYALLGYMENSSEDIDTIDTEISSGNAHIYCSGNERCAAALLMAIIGWEQIANEYPDHVVIYQV